MGGRGAYSSSGGFTSYEYEAEEDRIGVYKVIRADDKKIRGEENSISVTQLGDLK